MLTNRVSATLCRSTNWIAARTPWIAAGDMNTVGRLVPTLAAMGIAAIACITIPAMAPASAASISLSEKLNVLKDAYPDADIRIDGNRLHIGTASLVIDDGRQKSHAQKLVAADIEDMLSQIYPIGRCVRGKPARNEDPGRIRNEAFMRAIFGNSRSQVASRVRALSWFGRRMRVTRAAGTDRALEAVRRDLEKLPRKFRQFLTPPGGSFNWRNIAGTKRLSVHSFAAAVDINTKYTDYWRWSGGRPGKVPKYRNKIPLEIVEIFERHGFIWGGKWYHFDTMHFEYRPALIAIARLAEQRGC